MRPLPDLDLLEVLSDVDEMSRRRPEILGFFSVRSGRGPRGCWGGRHSHCHPPPCGGRVPRHPARDEAAQRGGAGLGEWGLRLRSLRGEPHWEVAPLTHLLPQTSLQRLMSSAEESCRSLAFSLALRSIQNNPG